MFSKVTIPPFFAERAEAAMESALLYLDPFVSFDIAQKALREVRFGDVEYMYCDERFFTVTWRIQDDHVTLRLDDEALRNYDTEGVDPSLLLPIFLTYQLFFSLQERLSLWRTTDSMKAPDRSPESWLAHFTQLTQQLTKKDYRSIRELERQQALVREQFVPFQPYEWEWRPIFTLYQSLLMAEALFPKIAQTLNEQPALLQYESWIAERLVEDILDEVERAKGQMVVSHTLFGVEPFLLKLPELVERATMQMTELFKPRFHLYQMLWKSSLLSTTQYEAEKERLARSTHPDTPFFQAFFLIEEGEDIPPSFSIGEWTEEQLLTALHFAEYADVEDRGDIVRLIADIMEQELETLLHRDLDPLILTKRLHMIDHLFYFTSEHQEVREKMFRKYPLESRELYSNLLIEDERFDEWLAFNQTFETSPHIIENQLDFVIQKSPKHAVLAMHPFVLREIDQKTRPHYKRAVRFLKKMRTCANRAGMHSWWNTYVDELRNSFRRLRALQEEIEKGKIYL